MTWVPLHNHSMFSMLDGISKPRQMVERCQELGYTACALTDHGNISGSVQFMAAMHAASIKPILGAELYICQEDPSIKDKDTNWELSHLPVLAKSITGWKSLIQIISFSHHRDNFYRRPRIDLANLKRLGRGNLIAFSGHPGSDLANVIFEDPRTAYDQTNMDEAQGCLKPKGDRRRDLFAMAERYIDAFGRDNFYLELQVLDPENNPAAVIVAHTMQWLGRQMKLPLVATADSHYPTRKDADDQRILLCSALKTTLNEQQRKVDAGTAMFRSNFQHNCYHIPTVDEIRNWHEEAFGSIDEEAIVNATRIGEECADYDIRHPPILPQYPCPNGEEPDHHLESLCRRGWDTRLRIAGGREDEYRHRLERELGVIKGAGLSSYFLTVQDYCNWARAQGMMVGPGRGSGAGCLVSYLVGITSVDPIKYGLLFERFYNAGRNAPGHISLPDIDCDFPVGRRKEIIAYLKKRYGDDKVANIATFNSMKGRKALTEVLRARGYPFEQVKQITANIPDEARISEELQAMKDRGDEPSIIRYALESDPDSFREWCFIKDDDAVEDVDRYEGSMWPEFAQAMRLEGTKTNISTHAAGVVLASTPLAEMCPLVYDEDHDAYIAAMEYPDLEAMGQVKLDVLGVASLDKIAGVRSLLRYGYIAGEDRMD